MKLTEAGDSSAGTLPKGYRGFRALQGRYRGVTGVLPGWTWSKRYFCHSFACRLSGGLSIILGQGLHVPLACGAPVRTKSELFFK